MSDLGAIAAWLALLGFTVFGIILLFAMLVTEAEAHRRRRR